MTQQTPWFLILKPGDENLPGSPWHRAGAHSRGKVVVLPVWPMGWVLLGAFIASIIAVPLVIWLVLFTGDMVDVVLAAVLTVIAVGGDILALIFLIKNTSARWTPELAASLKARQDR
ncbi:hypothetical protein D3874_13475 [Oleomonas cavernae]|uniref:Uncharacterized protein n=1 Tax=Oleomonas cavernae TaxID=2320859 RepID=A0A418WD03_9PROT|nr:hypothetical protein [Oleomonas cavernae]RJF87905.1 hypothetical protein D3874_13475 [Oleomonas cavernae]